MVFEGLGGDPNPLESFISWEAAVLEEVNTGAKGGATGEGGVTLQAITLSMEP